MGLNLLHLVDYPDCLRRGRDLRVRAFLSLVLSGGLISPPNR
jgi:hypothetical protein